MLNKYARRKRLNGQKAETVNVDLLLVDDLAHSRSLAETVKDLGQLAVLAERMSILININEPIRGAM